jgi:hypothetical protein
MSNVKVQSSNEIQNSNWKTYDPQFLYRREEYFDIKSLELHLTFGFSLAQVNGTQIWQHLD